MGEILSHFLLVFPALFVAIDPLGIVPVFLSMTVRDSLEARHAMVKRACILGCGILIFFAVFGGAVFWLFQLKLSAFRTAGGFLLLLTSIDMMRARVSDTRATSPEQAEWAQKEDVAIVPLAVPLLAGPGAISTVLVLISRDGGSALQTSIVCGSILLVFLISYLILRASNRLDRVLKTGGLAVLERIMGLILAALGVQFITEGLRELLFKAG